MSVCISSFFISTVYQYENLLFQSLRHLLQSPALTGDGGGAFELEFGDFIQFLPVQSVCLLDKKNQGYIGDRMKGSPLVKVV